MLTVWGCRSPREQKRGGASVASFITPWGSRSYRAHGLISCELLDELWEVGEEIASGCKTSINIKEPDTLIHTNCALCGDLAVCSGQEAEPVIFRLLKECFRHDALPEGDAHALTF